MPPEGERGCAWLSGISPAVAHLEVVLKGFCLRRGAGPGGRPRPGASIDGKGYIVCWKDAPDASCIVGPYHLHAILCILCHTGTCWISLQKATNSILQPAQTYQLQEAQDQAATASAVSQQYTKSTGLEAPLHRASASGCHSDGLTAGAMCRTSDTNILQNDNSCRRRAGTL